MNISNAIRNVERVFMNFPDIASEETIESFEIAVEAMNKQDPMKPYEDGTYVDEDHMESILWRCPTCGESSEHRGLHEHCSGCGQKLDWSK